MKKHSFYLREDQLAFLRKIENASSFIREALDQLIAKSDRAKAEKTIVTYNAIQELRDRIDVQALLIETNGEKTDKLNEAIEEAKMFLRLAQKIAKGQFEIEKHGNKFRALIKREDADSYVRITEGDTEEHVRTESAERGKQGVKGWKKSLEEAKQRKKAHKLT